MACYNPLEKTHTQQRLTVVEVCVSVEVTIEIHGSFGFWQAISDERLGKRERLTVLE